MHIQYYKCLLMITNNISCAFFLVDFHFCPARDFCWVSWVRMTQEKLCLCKQSETGASRATTLVWHKEEGRAERGQEMRLWRVVELRPPGPSGCVSAELQSQD